MATRKKKTAKTEEDYGREFFEALDQIEQEKGIKKEYMLSKIEQALASAYKKDHPGVDDNLVVQADAEKCSFRMVLKREVVEEVTNPGKEIAFADAVRMLPTLKVGDIVGTEIKTRNFGRIAAQTARQVIIQGIREAERSMVYDRFSSKSQEILTGVVHRVDPINKGLVIRIEGDSADSSRSGTDVYLNEKEQVPGEVYHEGDRLKVYVVEVRNAARGPQIMISRTHCGLVKRLFELEVPEIFDGIVEIRSISREPGSRTKMAVWSNDPAVDAIGACVGNKGARVNAIVNELKGEKVDIVKYSEDPAEFIGAALAPATVVSVTVADDAKTCRVVVPDEQLSLAIGKEGQNARLAAKLTGYKIDIKSVTDAANEPEELAEEDLLADEETEPEAPAAD